MLGTTTTPNYQLVVIPYRATSIERYYQEVNNMERTPQESFPVLLDDSV